MIVCVLGAGAREHALAHVLARSADVIVTPGNPGIDGVSPQGYQLVSSPVQIEEIDADLYVIGPEVPLVDGVADKLRAQGKLVFGPGMSGARLEGSKAFMKDLVSRAGVPTAGYACFEDIGPALEHLDSCRPPYVIKTDGLAAGKGVLVTDDIAEAKDDVVAKLSGTSFGPAGRRVVIEEGMTGEELSVHVLVDGRRAALLPAAQDHKRVFAGDLGPNTGGMGAYSPVASADSATIGRVLDEIIEPTLAKLAKDDIDYRGVLYAGCMLTPDGPRLIEYNVRFGDPEAQVLLPRLTGDVAEMLAQVAAGDLRHDPVVSTDVALCVVAAAAGYPVAPRAGDRIHGLDRAGTVEGVTIFHAGTARDEAGELVTSGGRVLSVSALASDLAEARRRAYRAMDEISFDGMHYRDDIAAKAALTENEVGSR